MGCTADHAREQRRAHVATLVGAEPGCLLDALLREYLLGMRARVRARVKGQRVRVRARVRVKGLVKGLGLGLGLGLGVSTGPASMLVWISSAVRSRKPWSG